MTGTNAPRGSGAADGAPASRASRVSRASARELIEAITDPGSWSGWDEPVEITTDDPDYRADLERARERTGLDESVITGEGRIEGRRVALIACEFRFLAGSIGVAAGERLVRAVERATAERLPLLAAPASGGTRMQEGTVAFLQMVKVAAAITDHKAAGLPYLVHLRHPTTGGVLASWGSLGHVTAAEPGALIGFMGPRVHEALYGEEFPPGVQNAENLMNHGLIDAVLPLSRLSGVAARVLRVLCAGEAAAGGATASGPAPDPGALGEAQAVPDAAAPPASAVARGSAGTAAEAGTGTPGDAPDGPPGRRGGSSAGGGPSATSGNGRGGAEAAEAKGAAAHGEVAGGRWDAEAGPPSAAPGHVVPGGCGAERGADGAATAQAAGAAEGVVAGHGQAGVAVFAGAPEGAGGPSAEVSIRASRRAERPGVRDLLRVAAEDVSPLSGTGAGEHDPGLLLALARVGGTPCVVLGHNRRSARKGETTDGPGEGQALGPAGLRTARRGMHIAAELGLPLLTVIDTAGAALSREAEEGGLAAEIARCLADMVTLPAPTLCLLLGQGAGGAALALLPADRVVAARHAWLSPLPPEGASAILHRTTERAYEVAARQGVRSADLLAQGIVDRIVEEEDGDGPRGGDGPRDVDDARGGDGSRALDASRTPDAFLRRLGHLLGAELAALRDQDPDERLAARRVRHRRIGLPR
ncbi:acetyl-CoA carboxylase carboxyltransferase subunit alpha/beta [Streptomyces malaysiensis]|uniref:Acetyl-coenzyme A carboxylase carboxyl transferase subunits beta/alpha n=1 Tax=Streptomyces malaysiensis subsp. samsunensis TaxID=459658 RepID=A0A9X2M0K4_STRMQ|nr:acetyl-CoA carboxylase carboxyltransferase subunit alpha/beta [Streptomyces samsunensis]MCQ8832911.1 acetyl-CoA carboxylase carboxyltransferase subunit alpha/beta [Streptomyces samsunensis]